MRFLRFLPLALLLLACAKAILTPRLDFIGSSRFTSSTRTVGVADTLVSKIFAQSADTVSDPELRQVLISSTALPTRKPVVYPTTLSNYIASNTPNDTTIVYMDSTLAVGTRAFAMVVPLSTRTTAGTEQWHYLLADATGGTASRRYNLIQRRTDSAALFHSYRLYVSPANSATFTSTTSGVTTTILPHNLPARLAYMRLWTGLLLPGYSIYNNANSLAANQSQIDLVCVINSAGISLTSPTNLATAKWTGTRRTTTLGVTSLDSTGFSLLTTSSLIATAYSNAAPTLSTSPVLTKGMVLAFRTADQKRGALFVSRIAVSPYPIVVCKVIVEK